MHKRELQALIVRVRGWLQRALQVEVIKAVYFDLLRLREEMLLDDRLELLTLTDLILNLERLVQNLRIQRLQLGCKLADIVVEELNLLLLPHLLALL